jgi:hypothetical protein
MAVMRRVNDRLLNELKTLATGPDPWRWQQVAQLIRSAGGYRWGGPL